MGRRMKGFLAVAAAAVLLALSGGASATGPLPDSVLDLGSAHPTLKVNAKGIALFEYRTSGGVARHILAWGAVNGLAHQVDPPQAQQRFQLDYSGGWKSQKNASYWKTFKNACKPYDGPQ